MRILEITAGDGTVTYASEYAIRGADVGEGDFHFLLADGRRVAKSATKWISEETLSWRARAALEAGDE